ncbi:MAG: endonuclease [Candidatus Harrisonbacteria bacterium CG10_big_fil_rev_8_21_14_0_10_44_23]|uniref:Endonuclease n=1 Tax=Candidatus Harrisonbacteria bacterium CG10_big_fil_rev_8_21_14_0_10_44_23 TaxID=1974585 RepID=A0A2H0URN8_9BACT|nr:MAG: endonuclease [Candidatus Harrisonbacteria bacterium CG10_big_fil_rev_8_21_14_0_10_44_23]
MIYVYVLRNQSRRKIYVGHTSDLDKRLARHNGDLPSKATSFTAKNDGFWRLIYKEEYGDRRSARRREKQLKSAQGRKFIHNLLS